MAQTVIALFDNVSEAQEAIQALISQGFDRNRIDISQNSRNTATDNTSAGTYNNADSGDGISNFFSSLFGTDNDDYSNYLDVARRESTIVTVHAQSAQEAQTAATLLDQYNAIDVKERSAQFRGQTGTQSTGHRIGTSETRDRTDTNSSIPIVEEQLNVGKQTVETGGARLRSRIVEKPVEENVRLREEHVHVERHPVNRPATQADINNIREGEVKIRERAEVPVVNKQARVVEEVNIGKETTERQETVRDTVRKTDVDVEHLESDTDINDETRRRAAKR